MTDNLIAALKRERGLSSRAIAPSICARFMWFTLRRTGTTSPLGVATATEMSM